MKYDEALSLWGATMLARSDTKLAREDIDLSTVTVTVDIDPGFACCGGRDPGCYCSFATSPRTNVEISGTTVLEKGGMRRYTALDAGELDFTTLLKEILEVSGGSITA